MYLNCGTLSSDKIIYSERRDALVIERKEPLLSVIKQAANCALTVWERSFDNKPNLDRNKAAEIIRRLPDDSSHENILQFYWKPRESEYAVVAKDPEKEVFYITFNHRNMSTQIHYFLKGFLYENGAIIGVELQSFRRP